MPPRPHHESCGKRTYEGIGKREKGKEVYGDTEEIFDEYMEGTVKEGDERDRTQAHEGSIHDAGRTRRSGTPLRRK